MSTGYIPDKYPVVFDEGEGQLYYLNNGNKAISTSGGGGTILQSADDTLWQVGVNDSGVLETVQVGSGTPGTLTLFSPNNTQWEVTVSNEGALITTEI